MTLIHRIVNAQTGEIIEKPYLEEQLAEVEQNKKRLDDELKEIATKNMARQAILDRLGLTEDEARLLLG